MTLLLVAALIFVVFGLLKGYRESENKKRYLLLTFTILPLVVSCLFLFGPLLLLSPIKPGFSTTKADNDITLFYPSSRREVSLLRTQDGFPQEPKTYDQKEIIQMALNYSQEAIKKNEDFYKVPVRAKILLVYGQNDLFRFAGILRGGGTGNEFGIVIDEQFLNKKLISHELSHDAIRNLLGPANSLKLPTWFDEGMATYIAKQDHYLSQTDAKNLLAQGQFDRDLSRWEGFFGKLRWKFTDIQRHGKTYGHVFLFTKYLFDTYGEGKMYSLILAVKNDSFDNAFQNTLGISPKTAHNQFLEKIEKEI